jgi:hypothetical protein
MPAEHFPTVRVIACLAGSLALLACHAPVAAPADGRPASEAATPVGDARRPVTIGEIDPESYPGLEEKELGQLRWVLALAARPLADFTDLESKSQTDMTAYRYSLAFSVYFLALEQYHKLPAWDEAIRPAIDTLIRKMIQKPVWDYWATTSKGIPWLEPGLQTPYPSDHDPVANKNIMYSGHLAHAINLYATLYQDRRWDQPGSIVFQWADDERYLYDNYRLTRVMYDQFLSLRAGAACEPNAIFPQCNQHPVLAFVLYDRQHGTSFSAANQVFWSFFTDKKLIDPVTHETAALYLIKQNVTVSQQNPYYQNLTDLIISSGVKLGMITLNSATANGWTGAFMHAWQPAFIEEHYPYWKQAHVIDKGDGTAELKSETIEPWIRYGFMAMVAAEVGDATVRDKLLLYADRHFKPVWWEGTYHYPNDYALGVTNLTDKLLAIARATRKNSLLELHQAPFDAAHFTEPAVAGASFPDLPLRRAIYDRARRALVVSTAASDGGGLRVLQLVRLDPRASYQLYLDGKLMQELGSTTHTAIQVNTASWHHVVLLAR